MRERARFLGIAIIATSALLPSAAFSQAQAAQNRIPQQIVINGQMANGAYVTGGGGQLQSFSCSTPQHYTTADGSSQGWACYEQTTGVWLLNALAPAQVQAPAPVPVPQPAPQQPVVIYQQPPPPAVIYQQPPAVIYQQPHAVIYQQPAPTVVYAPAPRPVVVAPAYPSSVVLGRAAINAAGRIASAAIIANSRHSRDYYPYYDNNRYKYDRHKKHDRDRGRRW
jgi:hypothetical protein